MIRSLFLIIFLFLSAELSANSAEAEVLLTTPLAQVRTNLNIDSEALNDIKHRYQGFLAKLALVHSNLPEYVRQKVKLPLSIYIVDHLDTKDFDGSHILISSKALFQPSEFRLLVHEYFHAVHDAQNSGADVAWFKEGLAQLFEKKILGTWNNLNLQAVFSNPNVGFFSDYKVNSPNRHLYGLHMLYFGYIYENCGGDDLFWDLVTNSKKLTPEKVIASALRNTEQSSCKNFDSTLKSFYLALSQNQNSFNGSQIVNDYKLPDARGTVTLEKIESTDELNQFVMRFPKWTIVESEKKFLPMVKNVKNIDTFFVETVYPFRVQTNSEPLSQYKIVLLKK